MDAYYYVAVVLGTALTCVAIIILLKKPFFKLAVTSVKQLDLITDATLSEDEKDRRILANLGQLLIQLFIAIFLGIISVVIGVLPVYLYLNHSKAEPDVSSIYFYASITAGSLILFLPFTKKKSDYNYWSRLLHTIILDNYSLGRYLFKREKKNTATDNAEKEFVIITGLARAGTTALTNLLFDERHFHSISYANMPFLMAPGLWRKVYDPKKAKKKERAHKDSVLFGYTSVEAFEEYFFKVKTGDSYIAEEKMHKHAIPREIFEDYLAYQQLFKKQNRDTRYLAKNNNFMLKYASLRQYDQAFKVVLIIREPVAHALSLLRQHKQFIDAQKEDPFTLQYMDWLGHHEFGLHQKVFDFGNESTFEHTNKESINYWLEVWVNYYAYINTLPEDGNLAIVEYGDLLQAPDKLKAKLSVFLGVELKPGTGEAYQPKHQPSLPEETDQNLYKKALSIYNQLRDSALIVEK